MLKFREKIADFFVFIALIRSAQNAKNSVIFRQMLFFLQTDLREIS